MKKETKQKLLAMAIFSVVFCVSWLLMDCILGKNIDREELISTIIQSLRVGPVVFWVTKKKKK